VSQVWSQRVEMTLGASTKKKGARSNQNNSRTGRGDNNSINRILKRKGLSMWYKKRSILVDKFFVFIKGPGVNGEARCRGSRGGEGEK